MSNNFNGWYPVIYPDTKQYLLRYFNLDKIMCNVRYLNRTKKISVHKQMMFKGIVFLDSDSLKFIDDKSSPQKISQYRINLVKWYKNLKPNICTSFDIPSSLWCNAEIKKRNILLSIKNYQYISSKIKTNLVLGISSFSERSLTIIHKKIERNLGNNLKFIALGGQVPLLRLTKKYINLGKLFIKTVFNFSHIFSKFHKHVFGAGGKKWYPFMRLMNIDSMDYGGYVCHGGNKRILLSSVTNPIYLNNKIILKNIKKKINECRCPGCRNNIDNILFNSRIARIIHNFYITINEVKITDRFINDNNLKGLKSYLKRKMSKDKIMKQITDYTFKLIEGKS